MGDYKADTNARHLSLPGVLRRLFRRAGDGDPEGVPAAGHPAPDEVWAKARPVEIGGQTCVAGLTWQSRGFNPVGKPGYGVNWRDLHAGVDDPAYDGLTPLIAFVTHAVEETLAASGQESGPTDGRVAVAVEQTSEKLWWGTMMMNGRPLPITEYLFSSRQELIAWIDGESAEIDRVITVGDFASGMNISTPTLRLAASDLHPSADPPEFRRRQGRRVLKGVGVMGILIGLGCLGISAWSTVQRNDVTEIRFVPWEVELEPFMRSCETTLSGFWPRPPGWELDVAGCAAAGMVDDSVPAGRVPAMDADRGVAYHRFRLKAGHNAVLARAAAELLYETWDGDAEINAGEIVLTREFALTMVRGGGPTATRSDDLFAEAERRYLGLAAVTAEAGTVRIESDAGLGTLLARVRVINQQWPLSVRTLRRGGGGVEIVIEPRRQTMRESSG